MNMHADEPMQDGAVRLNQQCFCITTDEQQLFRQLTDDAGAHATGREWAASLAESHQHLFAGVPVFVTKAQLQQMSGTIAAVQRVVASRDYQQAVLAYAPSVAHGQPSHTGVLYGFDFHLSETGTHAPQLIEINSNAGGVLLSTAQAVSQRGCCKPADECIRLPLDYSKVDKAVFDMFIREWQIARGERALGRIAIVDASPHDQYLYPEFVLFQRLFLANGISAVICDAAELTWADGVLTYRGDVIDMVYNRLTDFYFNDARYAALRGAYEEDGAVVTPHPRGHALYANKRNLALLSDADLLRRWGVAEQDATTLQQALPRTVQVDEASAQALWEQRKSWFFKPVQGYGSRGSYRGDKLTRKVFQQIVHGAEDYVAQAFVAPSERAARVVGGASSGGNARLKVDVRNYVYEGRVIMLAARLYQGQTTNMRTPGGGFASVLLADG